MQAIVRAIDAGYGNTKYVVAHEEGTDIRCAMFPSVSVSSLSDPARFTLGERRRSVAVPVDGLFHEVGPDAVAARRNFRGQLTHDDYVDSATYRALVCGALHYMRVDHVDVLVLGLPVAQYFHRRAVLADRWTGEHAVGGERTVKVHRVFVTAQPLGALTFFAQSTGRLASLATTRSLVIDVGAHTFDWLVARGLKIQQGESHSVNCGVFDLVGTVARTIGQEIGRDYHDHDAIDEALRHAQRPSLKINQRTFDLAKTQPLLEARADEAVASMLAQIGHRESFEHVVLVGGGAALFRGAVARGFRDHKIQLMKDPIYANVRGFQLLGEAQARKAAAQGAGSPAVNPRSPT
jgi:plasmid segregation protein ParM